MRPPQHALEGLGILAAGQRYTQTELFIYLGGTTTTEVDMAAEIRSCTGAAWDAFRCYANVGYDRMPKAEVREALLYGCSTWTLLTRAYGLLCTQHHRLLLRCVGGLNEPTLRPPVIVRGGSGHDRM